MQHFCLKLFFYVFLKKKRNCLILQITSSSMNYLNTSIIAVIDQNTPVDSVRNMQRSRTWLGLLYKVDMPCCSRRS